MRLPHAARRPPGRWTPALILFGHATLLTAGCAPVSNGPDPVVAGVTVPADDDNGRAPTPAEPIDHDGTDGGDSDTPSDSEPRSQVFSASAALGGEYDFRLFDLGPSAAGERWTVTPNGSLSEPLVFALFDERDNVLARDYVGSAQGELSHILRAGVAQLKLGVMTPRGGSPSSFRLLAEVDARQSPPGPQPQVVYLNFNGGSGVQVHSRSAISFGPFDATDIDLRYAGHSARLRDLITAEVRSDYAEYNVRIVSSADEPAPSGAHSVLHFGGEVSGLLGLADSVDPYNRELSESAIVYVTGFGLYRTMNLTVDEMAIMVANVASHEIGHLLGLYHTADGSDVMDTTGSAWDLAGEQAFSRAALEPSVFATGYEDSPRLLLHGVGRHPSPAKTSAARAIVAPEIKRVMKQIVAEDLPAACGTCATLDRD